MDVRSKEWQMLFNVKKCKVISVRPILRIGEYSLVAYSIGEYDILVCVSPPMPMCPLR